MALAFLDNPRSGITVAYSRFTIDFYNVDPTVKFIDCAFCMLNSLFITIFMAPDRNIVCMNASI